jgi:hypothetical protein
MRRERIRKKILGKNLFSRDEQYKKMVLSLEELASVLWLIAVISKIFREVCSILCTIAAHIRHIRRRRRRRFNVQHRGQTTVVEMDDPDPMIADDGQVTAENEGSNDNTNLYC